MIYVIGLVGVVCLYIVGIYAINKASAEALIKDLMRVAQGLITGGSNKKDFVINVVGALLKDTQSSAPLSAITTKVIEKQIDNIIESKVAEVKEEVKAQGQRIDLGAMQNANSLVDKVLVSEENGLISVYAKAIGNTESKRVDFEAGANLVYKL